MTELAEFAPWVLSRVNAFMSSYLESLDNETPSLKEMMSYGLLLGGKRARPLLVYAVGTALGQKPGALDYAAAAVECVHAYSLIHDDMPEMDNDRLRRGHETVHVKFSQRGALLAGDALQTLAFRIISDPRAQLPRVGELVQTLARAAGYEGMCGGQELDLEAEAQVLSLEELKLLHSKKTGALIRAAVRLGALCADADERTLRILDDYATAVGLGFQVWDDVLDVIGDTAVMGKAQGSDLSLDKSTYPRLLGLEQAKAYARDCAERAAASLRLVDFDTLVLEQFARFSVTRDH